LTTAAFLPPPFDRQMYYHSNRYMIESEELFASFGAPYVYVPFPFWQRFWGRRTLPFSWWSGALLADMVEMLNFCGFQARSCSAPHPTGILCNSQSTCHQRKLWW